MSVRPQREVSRLTRLADARARLRSRHGLDVRAATALDDRLARAVDAEPRGALDDDAIDRVAAQLRVGTTRLLRDAEQLDAIAPWLRERTRAAAAGWVLSAGCSTGEEAFTLAAMVLAASGSLGARSWRVVGVDVDPRAIDRARVAALEPAAVAALPSRLRRYFARVADDDSMRPTPALAAMLEWQRADLQRAPLLHSFDLIVCRNVLVYLDAASSVALLRRLSRHLAADGLLVVARAEASIARSAGLAPADIATDAAVFKRE
ncbi:MAG: CheR family methyltransferase [Polyangiales bacterium]